MIVIGWLVYVYKPQYINVANARYKEGRMRNGSDARMTMRVGGMVGWMMGG